MWDEITYYRLFYPTLHWVCDYLSIPELKLIDVSKKVPDVVLTHCGLVTPYGGADHGQDWFR